MQATNVWNKLNIYRYQVIFVALFFGYSLQEANAQNYNADNLADYENEWIHYGFHMGVHNSRYRIKYDDIYTSREMDSLHSIVPNKTAGWRVGFVVNMRLIKKYLDFRLLPTVAFYENTLTYRFTNQTLQTESKDATYVELPLMLKYKSERRGNVAVYMVGGGSVGIEVAGKGDDFDPENNLSLKNYNYSVDAGFGFDLYFPLFKFSPEIRYTWGLNNMLPAEKSIYSRPLESLTYENIAFYITFEGGPSYLKYQRKQRKHKKRK